MSVGASAPSCCIYYTIAQNIMQILRVFVSFVSYILFLITRQQSWTRYLTSNGDSDPRAKLEPEYLTRGRLFVGWGLPVLR